MQDDEQLRRDHRERDQRDDRRGPPYQPPQATGGAPFVARTRASRDTRETHVDESPTHLFLQERTSGPSCYRPRVARELTSGPREATPPFFTTGSPIAWGFATEPAEVQVAESVETPPGSTGTGFAVGGEIPPRRSPPPPHSSIKGRIRRSLTSAHGTLPFVSGPRRANEPAATALFVFAFAAITTLTAGASAEDTKRACARSAETGQRLRDEGEAARRPRRGSSPVDDEPCPAIVRAHCARWLEQIDGAIPTVVFRARARSNGNVADVSDVAVAIDGTPWLDALDGQPHRVEPGVHTFKYTRQGAEPVQARLMLVAGEKNRLLAVDFSSDAAPPADPPAAMAPSIPAPPSRPPATARDATSSPGGASRFNPARGVGLRGPRGRGRRELLAVLWRHRGNQAGFAPCHLRGSLRAVGGFRGVEPTHRGRRFSRRRPRERRHRDFPVRVSAPCRARARGDVGLRLRLGSERARPLLGWHGAF